MDVSILTTGLASLLGPRGWLRGDEDVERYVTEWRKMWRGSCLGVAIPATTQEVADVVRLCADAHVPITPQGGNTGLVGGGVPYGGVVLSTSRLNRIRSTDIANQTMTVEAGCILATVRERADDANLLFPLSLGAEGTCQIGGNLSTNAGGVGVLRYGNARDLVLGLEVVLPNGHVLDNLGGLRKDNTGYELNHLFMGAEGTLGIITAATLKLFPRPRSRQTTLIALPDIDHALETFMSLRSTAGDCLSAFEIIGRQAMALVETHITKSPCGFDEIHPYYALAELTSPRQSDHLRDVMEECLGEGLDSGAVSNALFAETNAQAETFWRLREAIPEAQILEGASIKHDISVPVSRIPALVRQAGDAVTNILPKVRIVAFGHMGDGNLHFNLSQPKDMDGAEFLEKRAEFNEVVHHITVELGGSFSAEHGIGTLKRDDLRRFKSSVAVDLMRTLKSSIDPSDIMNPGKLIPD